MKNELRSENTRTAALEAALTIIARDGAGRLTLDAIAKECGISKGRLTHQFNTKDAVISALLKREGERFFKASQDYLDKHGTEHKQPFLASRIAALREGGATPRPIGLAMIAALMERPAKQKSDKPSHKRDVDYIKEEALDTDMALLRWAAAWGISLGSLLGVVSVTDKEKTTLFEKLLDERLWPPSSDDQVRSSKKRITTKA